MISKKLTESRGSPFGDGFTIAEMSENMRKGDPR